MILLLATTTAKGIETNETTFYRNKYYYKCSSSGYSKTLTGCPVDAVDHDRRVGGDGFGKVRDVFVGILEEILGPAEFPSVFPHQMILHVNDAPVHLRGSLIFINLPSL